MGLFSFLKKNKKSNTQATSDAVNTIFDAVTESVTAYKMMEEDKASNGEQTKRNVVFQPEHITIKANRTVMTKGVPADYFFEGDERNKCAELPLLSPLKKLHGPVHSFAMMMTLALRFIPTLSEEAERIMTAQKARGADFSSGGLIQRAKALIPVLIPLFVSAFNRAGDLAIAMECRCYNGGDGRTRMNVRHIKFVDFIPLILVIAFGSGLVVLNIVGIGYTA